MEKHAGQFKKNDPRIGRKPKGAEHARTKFIKALKANSSSEQDFMQKILTLAESGNSTALGVACDRLWQKNKQTLPTFTLPETDSKAAHAEAIIEGMAGGVISPDAALSGMHVLRGATEITEVSEILSRLKELESK